MSSINSEADFEQRIREIITAKVLPQAQGIILLESKIALDIVLCKEIDEPKLFFIELKFFKEAHGRIGFGEQDGTGIQPEILKKSPKYFEKYLCWIFGSEDDDKYHVLSNKDCTRYFANNKVSNKKQNNFQRKLYDETPPYDEDQLVNYLITWLRKPDGKNTSETDAIERR